MALINNRSGQNSSSTDNDLAFTSQDLNDLAIRIGADLGLPDINDIHVGEESVNHDMLANVDQSQGIIDDKHRIARDGTANDEDMETIVIETMNDVDMSDAIVFGNVGNDVTISSSNQFDRQQMSMSGTSTTAKAIAVPRRTRTAGPAKIRAPHPQTQTIQSISASQPSPQQIRFANQFVTTTTTQPQIIPINALTLGQLNAAQVMTTASVVSPTKGQTTGKTKIIKKASNVTTDTNQSMNQTTDTSTLKVIYTSQGQQIVFSPSKQTTTSLNSNATVVSLPMGAGVGAPPGKVLLRPVGHTFPKTMAGNQPQQVIILSPMKTTTGGIGVTPIAANKMLPMKAGMQPIIAAKSPQRALAPAPTQPKIAISKASASQPDIKPVQLIRVVPISSQSQHQMSSISSNKFFPLRPIAPNTSVRTIAPIPQSTHRLIVPTTSVRAGTATFTAVTASPTTGSQTTTFLTTTGASNSGQVFMLPNPMLKIATTTTAGSTTPTSKSVSFATTGPQRTNFVPIAPSPMTASSTVNTLTAAQISSLKITNGTKAVEDPNQRKPCNCTKSQCLKLYCDCFANGEFCSSCNCISCHNNLDHEEDRQKAIRQCLERNPHAFHPKIGKGRAGDTERRHTKGCNCRRSGCLKNYCECYEAKILCSSLCKCCGCKNFEESFERKTLMHLADAAEVRSAQQNVATKNKLWSSDFKPKLPIRVDGDRLPCSFITAEVIEATCQCLLAQAEHGERGDIENKIIEKLVIEEFGRCLTQIIDCAAKTRNSKFKTEFM